MISHRRDHRESPESPSAESERPTLDLSASDGVAVVKIMDGMLSTAEEISDFEDELDLLVDAGYVRIALDFSGVSRFSKRALNVLIRVQQRFREAGVGLKLRGVHPQLAAGLGLADANPSVALPADDRSPATNGAPKAASTVHPDEGGRDSASNGHAHPAVDGPAPRSGAVARSAFDLVPLGVMYVDPTTVHEFDIAAILGSLPGSKPTSPAAASGQPVPVPAPGPRHVPSAAVPAGDAVAALSRVRLRIRSGSAAGKSIEIREPKFVIGRNSRCQFRLKSTLVSRIHASIVQRGGRVFVRDEGSSNGTTVNGRLLKDEEVEAVDGAHLDIGPMQFMIAITREPARPPSGKPSARAESPAPATAPAPAGPAESDFWSGVQFTCAIQPGSLVRMNSAPAYRTESTPVATTSGAAAWPGAPPGDGRAALEQLLHQLLRMLGNGGPAPQAPASSPDDETRSSAKPAAGPPPAQRAPGRAAAPRSAPPPPAAPAPAAEPVTKNTPRYAVAREGGTPSESDVVLYVQAPGTQAFDHKEPETPNDASIVGLDTERLLEEAKAAADDSPPTQRHEPQLDTELTNQRTLEIQFECPNCNEPGQVPINRMGGRFRCKVCQTDFRIDPSGTRAFDQEVPRMPIWKKVASAAAVIVLLLGGRAVANSPLFFGAPKYLTSYAIKAMAQDKTDQVLAIALPGAPRTARRWVRNVGPVVKALTARDAMATIVLVSQGDESAETTVSFALNSSGAPGPPAAAEDARKGAPGNPLNDDKGMITIQMYWLKYDGNWYIDGRKSLRGSSAFAKKYAQIAPQAR